MLSTTSTVRMKMMDRTANWPLVWRVLVTWEWSSERRARPEIDRQAGQEDKPEKYRCCRAQLPAAKEQRDRNEGTELPTRTE